MNFSDDNLLRLAVRNNVIVSIDEVENGKLCACFCPQCGAAMIAKNKGRVKQHHFAHDNDSDCKGSIESALHLLAKDILLSSKKIFIPHYKHFFSEFQQEAIIIDYARCLTFDSVYLEERMSINGETIVADALCEINGKKVIVEFAKSHFIDESKKEKLRQLGIPCIEFPISSGTQDRGKFTEELLSNTFKPTWIINRRGEKQIPVVYEKLKKEFDKKRAHQEAEAQKELLKQIELEQKEKREKEKKVKLVQAQRDRDLELASKKGNLITLCPIPKEISRLYYEILLGYDSIVSKLARAKEISDIYYKLEFVDVFIDGEREILIPENYPRLNMVEKSKWDVRLNTVKKFLSYRRSRLTGFCHCCKFFHGKIHEKITCSYNRGDEIENCLKL